MLSHIIKLFPNHVCAPFCSKFAVYTRVCSRGKSVPTANIHTENTTLPPYYLYKCVTTRVVFKDEKPTSTCVHHQEGLGSEIPHANGQAQGAGQLPREIPSRLYFLQCTVASRVFLLTINERKRALVCVCQSHTHTRGCVKPLLMQRWQVQTPCARYQKRPCICCS